MKNPFTAFAVIISVLPGLFIISVGVGPEPEEWSTSIGSLVIASGLLSLFVLVAIRDRLEKRARAGTAKSVPLLIVLAGVFLVIFFPLFKKSFVTSPARGTVYFPLWTTGDVKMHTERTGGRQKLLAKYGHTSVSNLVREMPYYEWSIVGTTALLLMLYQAAVSALSCAFLLLAFKKARTEPMTAAVSPVAPEKIIKILFLAANPDHTNRLRLDVEVRAIDESLRMAEFRDKFELKQQWAVRASDLQSHLLRHKPDIVHFSGHGSDTTEIILHDDDDLSHSVSPKALSNLFSVFKDTTRCVVLNACYSERQAKAIAEHIQCVVGMSKAISDEASISFAASFYQALGYGRDIKTAFQLGCGQIDLRNLAEEDTPKLLTASGIDASDLLLLEPRIAIRSVDGENEMNEQDFGQWWEAPPSGELSQALSMLLRDLFVRASAEFLADLANAEGPAKNVYEVREEHNPLIGICYHPSLTEGAPSLAGTPPYVFFQKWGEFTDIRRRKYNENETKRLEESDYRLAPRPFRMRYELYTEPKYALDLANRLVYPGDQETSLYFRTEELDGDVGWNWPLRIGFLPDDASALLLDQMKTYVRDNQEWIGSLVDLVQLDSETDSCDLLLIPTSINEACEAVYDLGIRISADCVVAIGTTTKYHMEISAIIGALRDLVSTAGVGIAPLDTSLDKWFTTLIRELAHNEPVDVALFSACRDSGNHAPFLAASRKLIEFSKLAESIKSIGEELLKAPPDAPPVTIQNEDAKVFGIDPGDYHPREIGEIFRNHTKEFSFDQERKSAARSARVSRSAKRSMRKSEKAEKVEPRWIQAEVYDLSAETPGKLESALRAGAPHKAVIRIGTAEAGWLQNPEEFAPPELSDKKTYKLTVIFTEPQLLNEPQVSSIRLPPEGNSTECEFTFQVREEVEKIEARISIVYKNRVLQTALLKADVVADPADPGGKYDIELVPEAIVRADLSGLNDRRNFDGAFILNHDTNNVPRLTAIKDKYVSFSSLGELDSFVKKVDEFMTQVADYPAEYAGKLNTPATVTLLCDLAKHGRILHGALVEAQVGNMPEIFSALSQTDQKTTQRIQIISAKSDTRLPMEFLYDRKAPADSNGQLCPKAVEALEQDACFGDCPGMQEPEKHVCPMGFWGLSKIIERHTYNPRYTERAVDGSFRFQSEPVEGRKHLDIFRGVLFGASNRADKIEVRSADGKTVTVEPGGLDKVLSILNTVTNSKSHKVTSWTEWRDKIKSAPSPTALLLLTHTEKSGSVPALEIEEGVLVEMQSIEEDYVYLRKEPYPPVVFLIGCETGAADIEFMNFVAQFRRGGAAIIVSTGAPIRGRHAVPVTLELLNQLKQSSDQPATSFGQVMRIVKQKMVAQGFPMVLTLMTYGDADWQIGTSKP